MPTALYLDSGDDDFADMRGNMDNQDTSQALAAAICKSASKQTYLTIRFFVDRERVADAYRAYAYMRWVDDVLDAKTGTQSDKVAFAQRQQSLLELAYRGEDPADLCAEEQMLRDLVHHDPEPNSGLSIYLRDMMNVLTFDAKRRGRLISSAQLSEYTRWLATAVTEALYYFIGHDEPPPPHPDRYLAVTAAHIIHMLRDTYDDLEAGYFNIPREYLQAKRISAEDVTSAAYREWVSARVELARQHFKAGHEEFARVQNPRCRLAGYTYMARFEWNLRAIEREGYYLRNAYPERKSWRTGLGMGWSALSSMLAYHG